MTVTTETNTAHLTAKLTKTLQQLPPAYDQLHLYWLPGTQPTDTGSKQRHGALSTRSLIHLAVLDLLDERIKPDVEPARDNYELDQLAGTRRQGVVPTIRQWVILFDAALWDINHEHQPPTEIPTIHDDCDWLLRHIGILGETNQPIGDLADDCAKMLRDIRAIVGTEEPIKLTCTKCGWKVEEMDNGSWYRCTACTPTRTWSRLELHRMAERKKPKTLIECAQLAGLSDRTLKRYKAQGLLKVVARQGTTEYYDIDEVMNATMTARYNFKQGRTANL